MFNTAGMSYEDPDPSLDVVLLGSQMYRVLTDTFCRSSSLRSASGQAAPSFLIALVSIGTPFPGAP